MNAGDSESPAHGYISMLPEVLRTLSEIFGALMSGFKETKSRWRPGPPFATIRDQDICANDAFFFNALDCSILPPRIKPSKINAVTDDFDLMNGQCLRWRELNRLGRQSPRRHLEYRLIIGS
jgi:hypothetical protein